MRRKVHNEDLGYIAERQNPYFKHRSKIVIYIAADQHIDVGNSKYATVCDAHGNIGGWETLPKARHAMKNPDEFCLECRELQEASA